MPIAKDIPRSQAGSGSSRFASAIQYAGTLHDRASEIAAVSKRFAASAVSPDRPDIGSAGELLRGVRVEHVILERIFSLETAAIELEAIAAIRPGVSNPVRHIVLSYDTARGETPTPAEIDRDVKTLLRQRGFTDAQHRSQQHHSTAAARFEAGRIGEISPFVAIVHGDTDSTHVHIIVSTVAENGAVNPDFRPYGANEHAAAMIAAAHGWEIVAGRKNGRLLAEQARDRGASEAEVEALLRRDAVTLNRMREQSRSEAFRSGTASSGPGKSAGRGSFVVEYSQAIQEAFRTSGNYYDFARACHEVGVIAKYTEVIDPKTGRVLPRMAYADSLDRAGDSGSRVGVSAKAVIEKFGSISADNRNFVAVAGERSSTKSERVRRKQGNASSDRLTSLEQTSVVTRGLGLKIAPSPPSRSMEHRSRSETTVRQLLPSERALVDAVLLHRSDTPRRSGGLDWTLGLLGFASRSLRALRRRRREKLLLEGREATGSAPTAPAKPTLLQREQERLAITKTAVLARDVQTVAGMEARDRALADVEMRASYAVWKDAELRKHLAGIETERAEAYDAYRLETRRQLQRAWDVEKVFRNVLRLMGVQGAEIRRAMSEAYQERRSAIQRSCKAIWAVAGKIKPSVMDYVDWLDEQSGTIADRARLHLQASARSQASNNSSAAPPDPAPAYAARIVEATHTIDTVSIGKVAPASAEHEASRFSAIFARSDAEALRDMGQRDAAREIEPAESIHAERAVAVERAISKAAKKILGAASFSHLDDVIQTAPGPERTAAFMAIRDEIFSAGAHRRARRGVEVPVVSNTGKVRRAEAWRDR